MRNSVALLAWALALLIGAVGASLTAKGGVSARRATRSSSDRCSRRAGSRCLRGPQTSKLALVDPRLAVWRPRVGGALVEAAAPGRGPAERGPKAAARRDARRPDQRADAREPHARAQRALRAGGGACPPMIARGPSFPPTANWSRTSSPRHRLTILQLGDSHTAADFFTGRVRERLQQVFGSGGAAYVVPGKPNVGVRSALFESDASDGWTYEALQKSDDKRRFYLSGFNAVARHAGASLTLRARGGLPYDRLEVAFLKQPGGGRAEVLVDGEPSGRIDLDGAADERATLDVHAVRYGRARLPRHCGAFADRRAGDRHRRRGRSRRRRRFLRQPRLPRRDRAAACRSSPPRISPTICGGWRRTSSFSPSAPTKASTTRSTSRPMARNTSRSCASSRRFGRACASSSSGRPTARARRSCATILRSATIARRPRRSRSPPTAPSAATCRRRPSSRRCAKRSAGSRRASAPSSGIGRRLCRARAARRSGPPPTRR